MRGEDRIKEIDYSSQLRATRSAYSFCNIVTKKATDAGRHAAAIELENLGVDSDSIAKMGHWAHGKLFSHYLGKFDLPEVFAMAGFHDARYDLLRDRLMPPLALQRMVFPEIEELHGGINPVEWKAECDKIMLGVQETAKSNVYEVYENPSDESEQVNENNVNPKDKEDKEAKDQSHAHSHHD
ncbi:hypothetical protein BGZ76_008088, partial [Entomortierella beljakovae]